MNTTTDLMRAACDVMGYHLEKDGYGDLCVFADEGGTFYMTEHWNIFGLIVEWIEVRGCAVSIYKHFGSGEYSVGADQHQVPPQTCRATTLPEAAALWIVEHGDKIKETT